FEDQALKWDSPWGVGYPGWHIECSCISMKHLGEYMDIHCGGVDNIFPHHTNEIAQSEAFTGHKWCNYWFHVHHLNDETGKMSKSKGEFLTVSLLEEKGYDPLAYRFFTLQSHYRKPLVFSFDALDQAAATYKKLRNRALAIKAEGSLDDALVKTWHDKFADAVGNDVNTAMGLTLVYDVIKADFDGATKIAIINDYDSVLGLKLLEKTENENAPAVDPELAAYVEEMIAKRAEAKKAKDFALADSIRDELKEKGVVIKDTREGARWNLA
ncbi:MAG: cysteine--tRNA ligase, partial [Lachnospiraceae bacterium]|nr:cysteine--tRNA ligase [Lachnospiraceae bacterium]